jgi:catechol 2,3-dioxygenase-like lactoylglutathione lyase family enzyme
MTNHAGSPDILGIHHVTAIASDPQPNLDFYVRFLGLRLVKRTVNFDDPETYHFYFGDETGRPGTILTFFPWPGARRGRIGSGQVTVTTFAVPVGSLDFWQERANRYSVALVQRSERFGEKALQFSDGDGLALELAESESVQPGGRDGPEVPAEYAIAGFHTAELCVAETGALKEVLTSMGFRETAQDGGRSRLQASGSGAGTLIDVSDGSKMKNGLSGAGTVHHIAFRTPDDQSQLAWQQQLLSSGFHVSPVMDRTYFHSIYFRVPGGILFEIATDPPGFLVDESEADLGTALKLPAMYEPLRDRIGASLPEITVPTTGVLTESY